MKSTFKPNGTRREVYYPKTVLTNINTNTILNANPNPVKDKISIIPI